MKLLVQMGSGKNFDEIIMEAKAYEEYGADIISVPEAYGFDAVSMLSGIAVNTSKIKIASSILNVFSRSPAVIAMTAVTLDELSNNRFILGLGTSGPKVIEGLHGMEFRLPLSRLKDVTNICQMAFKEGQISFHGKAVDIPFVRAEGVTASAPIKLMMSGKIRDIPIWWASLTHESVRQAQDFADGWISHSFWPERADMIWGDAIRSARLFNGKNDRTFEIVAGGFACVCSGPRQVEMRNEARKRLALYVGGMGSENKNFYNELLAKYGYSEEAVIVRELFRGGERRAAADALPNAFVDGVSLVGSEESIAERIGQYKKTGVTTLSVSLGGDNEEKRKTIQRLRKIVDAME